ncbi:hypothetical protein I7I50_12518 [Histoplasma capsulatum G186AR]|uniref:Uncharacterized protein n=1 Tax=Ajellomyces capsulatus TaxID=5037 RepID=A0A8H7Y7T0_AJECA|nr:hypothetical protein I7I52_11175 [Histoplasma capsulatum]QSS70779.1 hypothetical protein I7I50_12518 [Histoplasma capsulatum G186AR]
MAKMIPLQLLGFWKHIIVVVVVLRIFFFSGSMQSEAMTASPQGPCPRIAQANTTAQFVQSPVPPGWLSHGLFIIPAL